MRKLASISMLVGSLLLTACGATGGQEQEGLEADASAPAVPSVDRSAYSNVHAIFDYEKQTVETPLDKYTHTPDEHIIISSANFFDLKKCVNEKGQELIHHFYQTEYRSQVPFGVWSPQFAEKYGYEINHSLGRVYIDEGYKGEPTAEMQQALESCAQEIAVEEIPVFIKGFTISPSPETAILSEVSGQVTALVEQDPDVDAAIAEWTECLAGQGISIDTNYEIPAPITPEDKESNIKQALIDLQCKQDVRLMERYFDAQAQYEQALIEENQAAFNTLAERKEAYVNQAKDILRQNGINP